FQAEDGIRDKLVTGVQTCALPISAVGRGRLPPELRPPHVHGLAQGRLPQSPERGPRDGYASSARHPARRLHDAPAGEHRADAVRSEERRVGKEGRWREVLREEETE